MNTALETITVLLVDDHDIVRQGLKALLATDSGITVIAEARTGREAVRLAQELRPQVVVMDLAMPAMNGWEATRQILKAIPSAKVLVLSTYHEDAHARQAIEAGATAYLIKQSSAADLVLAIREVKNGNAYFSPAVAHALHARTSPPTAQPGSAEQVPGIHLSLREAEVLQLIAEGYANKQIAGELNLSVKTVEKHRQQLMNKLKIHNTAGLVRHAAAHDVIETSRAGVPEHDCDEVSSRHRGS
ncbi:MAG TPA: response regulator transcription factor [Candidatus Limnocylindrales bacterium]|nr:response regulator transcription factor [Candidatus Limnocylindrales bacterium]